MDERRLLQYACTGISSIIVWFSAPAQTLMPDVPLNHSLIVAEEQFQQGHYRLSAQSAQTFLNVNDHNVRSIVPGETKKATYYLVASNLKLGLESAELQAKTFIAEPENPAYRQRIMFGLAEYYFHDRQFEKAIPLYEGMAVSNLNNDEVTDEKFELAYCYFNNREFANAKPLLTTIKDLKDSKYYKQGNYYYGLIVYNENNYNEALKCFNVIRDDKDYKTVVPYYIAEIYYFKGDRERALKLADTLINKPEKSFYDNELHLLAAQCQFEMHHYDEAIPYYEYYYNHADRIRKEDLYEFAYCYYASSDWNNAIEKFKLLSDTKDTLGQTAMYLLGDCYLNTNDKKSARNAFGICSEMNFNEEQQESSLILYAKTSYELGFNDAALRSLYTLLDRFPATHYKDETNTIISDLLLKTNKYSDAMLRLATVNKKDSQYKMVYQKAAFGYAVQLFRNGDKDSAQYYLDQSLTCPVDGDYETAAWFWKGEIAYSQQHYKETIAYTRTFITKRGARKTVLAISPLATLQHAYLNMGYASMQLQDFDSAQDFFGQAQNTGEKDSYTGSLAILREADAVFMQKNYPRAITLYDKIIAKDSIDADYARYQKSILLGLQGKNDDKLALLRTIVNALPTSAYANSAKYESAVTYIDMDKYQSALPFLHELTDTLSGDRSYAPRSWLKIGFIYQQLNDFNMAIDAYKHVVIDYPASEDRQPALDALKNLYIQSNHPSEYTNMLKDNHLPSADSGSLDSTYYAAAETQYSSGKLNDALVGFNNYLSQYPNGIFSMRAHYYRAESYFQLKNYDAARQDYAVALSGPWNEFMENSALRAGDIAYYEKDYVAAHHFYTILRNVATGTETLEDARLGLLKSSFNTNAPDETSKIADTLLCSAAASAETVEAAMYYKAKSLMQMDSTQPAMKLYTQLAGDKNGDVAAESRYSISLILFNNGELKDAENAANQTIRLSSGYDYWIVKSYILLADILTKEKDYFNAKATLESVINHTKIDELKQEANQKLDQLKKTEKTRTRISEE